MTSRSAPGPAPGLEVQSAVEFAGLDEQSQAVLDSFRGFGRGPVLPRNPEPAGRPNTKLRQAVARQQSRLASGLVSNPLVAMYNAPSKEKSTVKQFFCEACAAYMPAREQDWQMHSSGLGHQSQLLSLCGTGELGHVPTGEPEANAGACQHVRPGTDCFC